MDLTFIDSIDSYNHAAMCVKIYQEKIDDLLDSTINISDSQVTLCDQIFELQDYFENNNNNNNNGTDNTHENEEEYNNNIKKLDELRKIYDQNEKDFNIIQKKINTLEGIIRCIEDHFPNLILHSNINN
jgi:hypothetical protein